jgi:hypothetical protein
MKIKILKSDDWYKDYVGTEFEVSRYDLTSSADLRFSVFNHGWIYSYDCVITELPESFCVKKSDDVEKWWKYVDWLNKTYLEYFSGNYWMYYGCIHENKFNCWDEPFGTEIHIDDMIKHIDYMESQQHIKGGEQFHKKSQLTVNMKQEFDLTTDEGRLAYAKKYYPIGTKYEPLDCYGNVRKCRSEANAIFKPRIWVDDWDRGIEVSGFGLIYHEKTNRWAEIVKEKTDMTTNLLELTRLFPDLQLEYSKELIKVALKNNLAELVEFIRCGTTTNHKLWNQLSGADNTGKAKTVLKTINAHLNRNRVMNTQKLSRQGLKEIHGVACPNWKDVLEHYGSRNPLEDYVELTQEEVDKMFNACTKEQLPIVSKYLKKDEGSVDIMKFKCEIYDKDGRAVIEKRFDGEYGHKSLLLDDVYDWDIKTDSMGKLCLIPTKKK